MALWRISRHRDLSGAGGLRASGRWHDRGSPIVYLAESPAGALLEVCVHTSANDVPPTYTLLEMHVDEKLAIPSLDLSPLPKNWPDHVAVTRNLGSDWLRSRKSALLRVPSVLLPATWNVLLNPLHPDAKRVKIVRSYAYPFDPRLKK